MDGNIRLSATVISYSGKHEEKDDFYFNGSFFNSHNTESIQCSFDKACNNYVFAVSDSIGMDYEGETGISAIREIKKYHEKARAQQFSLEGITEKIYEAVQLSSNLVYSQSVISNLNSAALTGFSAVVIDNNRAVLMNLGNNGVFLYRNGLQKEVFEGNDSRKNQKLKMLGITPNTADALNDTGKILKIAEEESKTKVKISSSFEIQQGDIMLLCSDGLLNSVGKNRIEAVINSGLDSSKMASILFQEAVKNFDGNGITIMALRVDEIRNIVADFNSRSSHQVTFDNEPQEEEEEDQEKGKGIVNYILAFICIIVISGILFMGYLIIQNKDFLGSSRSAADTTQASQNTAKPADDTGVQQQSQSSEAEAANSSVKSEDGDQSNTQTDIQNSEKDDNKNSSDVKSNTQKNNTGKTNTGKVNTGKTNTGKTNTDKAGTDKINVGKTDTDKADSQKNNAGSGKNGGTEKDSNTGTKNGNSEYDIHIVKAGDTLSSISSKYYGKPNNYDAIIKFNNLKNENLFVNQELKIPKLKK